MRWERVHEGKVDIVNQQWGDDYFAEEVVADGPWHARFIFCAKYRVPPDKVKVVPNMRGDAFWCEVNWELPAGTFRINSPYFRDVRKVDVPIQPEATSSFVVLSDK